MNNSTAQIVASYEEAGMTPEDIARIEELDLNAVKATLFTHSGQYRASVQGAKAATTTTGTVADKDFETDDNELALKVIREIAMMSEDDNVRLRAAMFIRNDKKKRLDPVKGIASLNLNLNVINEHFAKAAAAAAAKVLPASKLQQITDI